MFTATNDYIDREISASHAAIDGLLSGVVVWPEAVAESVGRILVVWHCG